MFYPDGDDFWDSTITFNDVLTKQKTREDAISLTNNFDQISTSKANNWDMENQNVDILKTEEREVTFYRDFKKFSTCMETLDYLIGRYFGDEIISLLAYLHKNFDSKILNDKISHRPSAISHFIRYLKKCCPSTSVHEQVIDLVPLSDLHSFRISHIFSVSDSSKRSQALRDFIGDSQVEGYKRNLLTEAYNLLAMENSSKQTQQETVGEKYRRIMKTGLVSREKENISLEELHKMFNMSPKEILWNELRVFCESEKWSKIVPVLYDHRGRRKHNDEFHRRVCGFVMRFNPPELFIERHLL